MSARSLILAKRRQKRSGDKDTAAIVRQLTVEWFDKEAAYFNDEAQLGLALCGRRAGKTRGGCRDFIRDALTIPGARLLYLNTTRGEAEKIAWNGNDNDGMRALCEQYKLNAKIDQAKLSIHFKDNDSWIWLKGADDEAELRKSLGGAYHKVWWDEAQKIPSGLEKSIMEVFIATLLDYEGKLRLTGTPSRQMAGLFYKASRPEEKLRIPGWSIHSWSLLDNPYFGRPALYKGKGLYVIWGQEKRPKIHSGPHEESMLAAEVIACRHAHGIKPIQDSIGGPDVAPLDSPFILREAFGKWTHEDSNYVYHVHKVNAERLLYAPARKRPDGFPDIEKCLKDLPFNWQECMYALGCDLGFNDPFALTLWAYHPTDPRLFEIFSHKKEHLNTDQQAAMIREVMASGLHIGQIVADAGGIGKSVVAGWSDAFVERYNLPIIEAEKNQKHAFTQLVNNDIVNACIQLRRGGYLFEEMSQLQYLSIVSGTGKPIEDPQLPNDVCDSALYAHRMCYQFRYRSSTPIASVGSSAWVKRLEDELEESAYSGDNE